MPKRKDLSGQIFNGLTVLHLDADRTKPGKTYWVCECSYCGNIKSIRSDSLKTSKSCGCQIYEKREFKARGKDITGEVFNMLTAISLDQEKSQRLHRAYWICRCECETVISTNYHDLTSGRTQSCGCLRTAEPNVNFKDMKEGDTFNMLTVIKRSENNKEGGATWECVCECGTITVVSGTEFRTGGTKSCGCLHKDTVTTHGASYTNEYSIYRGMKRRCLETYVESKNYFHKGISVCDRWLDKENGFNNFLTDMGKRPSIFHSVERKNVHLGYSPENCEWGTQEDQANNMTTTVRLTYNDTTLSIAQWARKVGISRSTLSNRMRNGWTVEDALTTQPMKSKDFNSLATIKSILSKIIDRCRNPKNKVFDRYGGRGITVSDEWADAKTGLLSFISDMGDRPTQDHSVERRYNDKGYSKENCFWAVPKVQANNKRNNRLIDAFTVTKTLAQWSDEYGLPGTTISDRLERGWDSDRAVSEPTRYMVARNG